VIKDDIKRINNFLADLKHYNRNVAESWYRIRKVVEPTDKQRIKCLATGCNTDKKLCGECCWTHVDHFTRYSCNVVTT
jgi:hypothetical protein